jgi:hypothetical protein
MTRIYQDWRGLTALFCFAVALIGGIDQSTKDALRVKHILRTIERHTPRGNSEELSVKVTENELNAYIAQRLAQEKGVFINRIEVDLLDDNHVRGKIKFDAQRLNLGVLLGTDLDFDFTGIFHTRNGTARLDLISLHLNGQPVKPQVLDFVLSTAALVFGTETGSIADWYRLPKGIKRIRVTETHAILYY